jgi:hypothetical protein
MRAEKVTFRLNLLENGLDFVLKGVDELFNEEHFLSDYKLPTQFSSQNFKYGCIHIFAGFLLILKEKLSRHLPELIYKGDLSAVREKLKNSSFPKTIDFGELLYRLEIGPRIQFPAAELQIMRRMQDLRNAFEHASVEVNKYEMWKVISGFLDIADNFLIRELQIDLQENAKMKKLVNKIRKIDSVWKRVEVKWKENIREELDLKLDRFRVNKKEIIQNIQLEQSDPDSDWTQLIGCDDCCEESLITEGDYSGVCISCEATGSITHCIRCNEPVTGFDWDTEMCEACRDYIAAQS